MKLALRMLGLSLFLIALILAFIILPTSEPEEVPVVAKG